MKRGLHYTVGTIPEKCNFDNPLSSKINVNKVVNCAIFGIFLNHHYFTFFHSNQFFLRFTILEFQNLERFSKFYDSRSYLAANHVVLVVFNCQFYFGRSREK